MSETHTIFPSRDNLFIDNGATDIEFSSWPGDGSMTVEVNEWYGMGERDKVILRISKAQVDALRDWLNGVPDYTVR